MSNISQEAIWGNITSQLLWNIKLIKNNKKKKEKKRKEKKRKEKKRKEKKKKEKKKKKKKKKKLNKYKNYTNKLLEYNVKNTE